MLNQFLINREREQLKNLRMWATRAPLSGILIFAAVFFDMTEVLFTLCALAIGFSVYILQSLIRLGRKGWAIAYAIVIGLPFLLLLGSDVPDMMVYALWFVPLVIFYLYCWVLRFAISEWLSDLGDEQAFIPERKPDQHFEDFFDRFK